MCYSQEYPDDTFVNQLAYLVLLYLADPASTAITTSLGRHA